MPKEKILTKSLGKAFSWVRKAEQAGMMDARAQFDERLAQYEQKKKERAEQERRQAETHAEWQRQQAQLAAEQRRHQEAIAAEEQKQQAAAEAEQRKRREEETINSGRRKLTLLQRNYIANAKSSK
jgi:hypothetical protein